MPGIWVTAFGSMRPLISIFLDGAFMAFPIWDGSNWKALAKAFLSKENMDSKSGPSLSSPNSFPVRMLVSRFFFWARTTLLFAAFRIMWSVREAG